MLMTIIARLGLALGATALSLMPVAASANTRASETRTYYTTSANGETGLQRSDDDELNARKAFVIDLKTILLGTAGLAVLIALLADSGSSSARPPFQSNGAN